MTKYINKEYDYLSVTKRMKIKDIHKKVLNDMRESCLEQLRNDREATGFLEYRSWQNYDPEVGEVIKNEIGKDVDACYDLCALGIFEEDMDSWHTTFVLADEIDWTEI